MRSFPILKIFIIPFIFLTIFQLAFSQNSTNISKESENDYLEMVTYIWNEKLGIFARTSCKIDIAGTEKKAFSNTCSNTDTSKINNFLEYYHNNDPDNEAKLGKIKGSAYSPILGLIEFDETKFPAGNCYGINEKQRQPRIIKSKVNSAEEAKILLVGCAYSPLLRDYILLSPYSPNSYTSTDSILSKISRPQGFSTSDWASWKGVNAYSVYSKTKQVNSSKGEKTTNAEFSGCNVQDDNNDTRCLSTPYLELFGCAWSSKNKSWAFSPNQSQTKSINNCFKTGSGYDYILDQAGVGSTKQEETSTSIQSRKSKVRIGQTVIYEINCPSFNRDPEITLLRGAKSEKISAKKIINNIYSAILLSPITRVNLLCKDNREFFGSETADGAGVGVSVVFISSFNATPQVIKEGGIVNFRGTVSNQQKGNEAKCSIYRGGTTNFPQPKPNPVTVKSASSVRGEDLLDYKITFNERARIKRKLYWDGTSCPPTYSSSISGSSFSGIKGQIKSDEGFNPRFAYCVWAGEEDGSKLVYQRTVSGGEKTFTNTISEAEKNAQVAQFSIDSAYKSLSNYSDIVVRDTNYSIKCTYNILDDDNNTKTKPDGTIETATITERANVKVLPDRAIEKNIEQNIPLPMVKKDGDKLTFHFNNNNQEVRIYLLDKNGNKKLINNNSLKSILYNSTNIKANPTDKEKRDAKDDLFKDDEKNKVLFTKTENGKNIGELSISVNDFTGKKIIYEVYSKDGGRSPKCIIDVADIKGSNFETICK